MEQFNKIVKCMWRALGANVDEKNAARVADAIESMEKILESIDEDCALSARKGYRSNHEAAQSVQQVVSDLVSKNVFHFHYTPNRVGHPSFPKASANLLQELEYRDLHEWMKDRLKEWATILQR